MRLVLLDIYRTATAAAALRRMVSLGALGGW